MRKPLMPSSWWKWITAKLHRAPSSLGTRGEQHAARYLRKKGFRILARNRRHKEGEIDIIAMDREFLVFVEVRTRSSEAFMTPEASIRLDKRRTVRRTVRRLIRKHRTAGLRPRIDVIGIVWPEGAALPSDVRHHRGVIALDGW